MFREIKRDDAIFKSKSFLQDALAFNVMISIVERTDRYPTPKVFSNGHDCIIVNTDPQHAVIIWTADSFNDYEGVFNFVQEKFADNEPFKIMSKTGLYDFLKSKDKVDTGAVLVLGTYQCKKLNDIEYIGYAGNAKKEELPVVAKLFALFGQETGENKSATTENCMIESEDFLTNPLSLVWRDTNNKIVAIARIRNSEKYSRIGYVITDPDERGKSYAKMLVHYLTKYAMSIGKTPMLFTDFEYAPSNKCYTAVGYELVCTIPNYKIKTS